MSVPTSRTSQMYTAFTKLVRFAGSGGVVEGDQEDSQEDMIALNVRSTFTNNINLFTWCIVHLAHKLPNNNVFDKLMSFLKLFFTHFTPKRNTAMVIK